MTKNNRKCLVPTELSPSIQHTETGKEQPQLEWLFPETFIFENYFPSERPRPLLYLLSCYRQSRHLHCSLIFTSGLNKNSVRTSSFLDLILVTWNPIPIEAVVCVHKNSPFREFLLYWKKREWSRQIIYWLLYKYTHNWLQSRGCRVVTCRQIAPPSFSGTPDKKTDSANFSFITLCRSSRGWSEVERARPHSLARNVLTRCSPQPVVLTAVLCEVFSTGFWAQHPQPKQLAW